MREWGSEREKEWKEQKRTKSRTHTVCQWINLHFSGHVYGLLLPYTLFYTCANTLRTYCFHINSGKHFYCCYSAIAVIFLRVGTKSIYIFVILHRISYSHSLTMHIPLIIAQFTMFAPHWFVNKILNIRTVSGLHFIHLNRNNIKTPPSPSISKNYAMFCLYAITTRIKLLNIVKLA